MWLMLNNHLEAEKILAETNIPVLRHTIIKPMQATGLAFPEEEKDKVLKLLGLQGKNFTTIATDNETVFLLEEQGRVSKIGIHLQSWTEFLPVLEEYAELLNINIVVSNPHLGLGPKQKEMTQEPEAQEGTLFIKFCCIPVKTKTKQFDEVFGFMLGDNQKDGWETSGQGQPIIDFAGITVAEVIGDNLYILFDLPHDILGNNQEIMRHIMEQYTLLKKSPEELQRWRDEAVARELNKTKNAYIQECSKRLKMIKEQLEEGIEENEEEIAEAGRRITDLVREMEEKRKQLFGFDDLEEREKRFASEYDKLMELPHVKNVKVEEGKVKVFTDTIFLENEGEVYEMGDYRIDIPTEGTSLRITNLRANELTGQTYYHHPHVTGKVDSATPCLGNILEGVSRLIGSYEFSVVAQIIIEYLHTCRYTDKLKTYWKPMQKTQTA